MYARVVGVVPDVSDAVRALGRSPSSWWVREIEITKVIGPIGLAEIEAGNVALKVKLHLDIVEEGRRAIGDLYDDWLKLTPNNLGHRFRPSTPERGLPVINRTEVLLPCPLLRLGHRADH